MTRSRPIRVLHLCAGNLYGGVERVVLECARARTLSPAMAPEFAVCFEGRLSRELTALGVRCSTLGPVRASRPHSVWRSRRVLRALIDEHRPDVVLSHCSWMFAVAAPAVPAAGTSAVLWLHDRVTGRTWVERWARRRNPAAIVANSRFTAESAAAMYPDVRRTVVRCPVGPIVSTPGVRARVRGSLGVSDGTTVIVLASRMQEGKGHRALLDAAAGLSGDFRIWIAGAAQRSSEAAYERSLHDLARSSRVTDRVQFLGARDDISDVLLAADVLCQPNTAPESFGIAFIEAMYAGLPVVTTAMGGPLEIVTAECGVLVAPDDRAALAAALQRLVSDSAERRRLGSAGPSRAGDLCDPARQLGELADALAMVSVGPTETCASRF